MRATGILALALWTAGLGTIGAVAARADERLSFRLGYSTYAPGGGDLGTWIQSCNGLWSAWQAARGGSLEGGFAPLDFGPGVEGDLRIHIFAGLGFVIGGSRLRGESLGAVTYRGANGGQVETHALVNRVTALPLKIGLDFRCPISNRLQAVAGAGRQLIFVKYDVQESYEARFSAYGEDFVYWFERDGAFRSEGLGVYAGFGLEYTLLDMLAVVLMGERIWSGVDGFKGPASYRDFETEETGRASLYYYESDLFGLREAYPVLSGHRERPEGSAFTGVRQGRLDFGGFALKLGLRLKI